MAVVHLDRLRPQRQRQHLVAKADAEHRQVSLVQDRLDHRNSIFARRRRIAGAVGQEYPVGIVRQHLFRSGGCGQNRHITACTGEAAQDVALRTIVDGHHLVLGVGLPRKTIRPGPPHFVPAIGLRTGDVFGQIQPFETGESTGLFHQRANVEFAFGVVFKCHMRRAKLPDRTGQAAGVDATDGNASPRGQPLAQFLNRAPVRALRRHPLDHHTLGHGIAGFVIVRVHTHVADMGKGEGHDLARVGRVGHDLLIARHRGVEAEFRHRCAGCPKALTVENRAIRKGEAGGRCVVGKLGHGATPQG